MTRRLVLAIAAVLLVTGCGGDPEPKMADPAPTSASPSPSTEVSESAEPETAEAFIRRWAETSTAMQNSGDTAAYREITKGCVPCSKLAGTVDRYYGGGGFVRFDGLQIGAIERQESTVGVTVLDVDVVVGATEYASSEGASPASYAGGASIYRMTLSNNDGWNIDNYVELAS